jgi:hypothetical protein
VESDTELSREEVFQFQKKLINELLELYSPEGHHSTPIKIGERVVQVYPFHYPPHSFAFSIKTPSSKVLSFICKNDIQLLRKWTIKAALIISDKDVSFYDFSCYILSHINLSRDTSRLNVFIFLFLNFVDFKPLKERIH